MFFSGSFFPLATPSSIDDHISFFASALLGLSCSLADDNCVYVEVLLFVEAIVASASLAQEVCNWGFPRGWGLAGWASNANIQICCLPCILNGLYECG
jgi:hypothetical protein